MEKLYIVSVVQVGLVVIELQVFGWFVKVPQVRSGERWSREYGHTTYVEIRFV